MDRRKFLRTMLGTVAGVMVSKRAYSFPYRIRCLNNVDERFQFGYPRWKDMPLPQWDWKPPVIVVSTAQYKAMRELFPQWFEGRNIVPMDGLVDKVGYEGSTYGGIARAAS